MFGCFSLCLQNKSLARSPWRAVHRLPHRIVSGGGAGWRGPFEDKSPWPAALHGRTMVGYLPKLVVGHTIGSAQQGLRPTAYGECLIRHSRSMLVNIHHARDELRALSSGVEGKVRVGVFPTWTSVLLPSALSLLRQRAPGMLAGRVLLPTARPVNLPSAICGVTPKEDATRSTWLPRAA